MRAGLTAAREAAFAFPENVLIQFLAAEMQDEEEDAMLKADQAGDAPVADGGRESHGRT